MQAYVEPTGGDVRIRLIQQGNNLYLNFGEAQWLLEQLPMLVADLHAGIKERLLEQKRAIEQHLIILGEKP